MKSDLCFGIMEASALDMAGCVACALKFFFLGKVFLFSLNFHL